MNKEYIEKIEFEKWYKEIDNTYNLMMSDDIDSLSTALFLKNKFNCNIDMFNSFSDLYISEDTNLNDIKREKLVGIDLDLAKNNCFSNHVTYIQNQDCISLNKNIKGGCNDYFNKFAGSTLLTVLSLYNHDLNDCTPEQLEVLISIDTAFKQYYFNEELFKKYYDDILEYDTFQYILKNKNKDYFYNIIKKYKLHEKIYINSDGNLETNIQLDELSKLFNIDISLPKQKFNKFYNLETVALNERTFQKEIDKEKIFSSAFTNRNFVCASVHH